MEMILISLIAVNVMFMIMNIVKARLLHRSMEFVKNQVSEISRERRELMDRLMYIEAGK